MEHKHIVDKEKFLAHATPHRSDGVWDTQTVRQLEIRDAYLWNARLAKCSGTYGRNIFVAAFVGALIACLSAWLCFSVEPDTGLSCLSCRVVNVLSVIVHVAAAFTAFCRNPMFQMGTLREILAINRNRLAAGEMRLE